MRQFFYDIKPARKEEGKFYWKIPLGDDDATREKMHTTSHNLSVLYVLKKHRQHINNTMTPPTL